MTNDPPDASKLFTDRHSESVILKDALAAHRRNIDRDEDIGYARRNILVYYGGGGFGKTTLSARLEKWVKGELSLMNEWGNRPSTRVDVSVRMDLSEGQGQFDVIAAVISLRRELGVLKKSWPAFDFAFAAYWEASHPGQAIPAGKKPDNGFSDAMEDIVVNVATDLGVFGAVAGLGLHSVKAVVAELRNRRMRRLAFEAYDGYRDLLERCAELPSLTDYRADLVVEMAMLLAMDLANSWENSPLVVVFVDTVERLRLDPRRTGERLLNQLVANLPNILFVMTGRHKLDWYEETRANLHLVGHAVWPGLVPGSNEDPRQHLMGKLSDEDTRKVILRGIELHHLDVPDAIIESIVEAAGGLPLYLDLVRLAATNAQRNGRQQLTLEDVSGTLDELVIRVLEYIPADEQRALRAACLFAFFDVPLVAAAANVDVGTAERAARHPMIDHLPNAFIPYRMHDEVRSSIRNASHSLEGGWAAADWTAAGTRALHEARNRFVAATGLGKGREALAAVGLAISIVCEVEVQIGPSDSPTYADWLSKAIVFGPSIEGLVPYIPVVSKTHYGQILLDFVRSRTIGTSISEAQDLLAPIFNSDHPLALPAGRHLAYRLRNNDQMDDAVKVFDELIVRAPTNLNKYQRCLTLASARRFSAAVADSDALSELNREAILASSELSHGNPEAWLERHPGVLARKRAGGSAREILEQTGSSLRHRAIYVGDVSEQEVTSLLAAAEAVGYGVAIRDCMFLNVISCSDDSAEVTASLERLDYLDRLTLGGRIGYRTAFATALRALITGETGALAPMVTEVNQKPFRSRAWIPIEFLLESLGAPLVYLETDWLYPVEVVRSNWSAIFTAFQARAAADSRI